MGKIRIFLDTNVLVDYLNKREPFFADASKIIDLCVLKQADGVLSSLSIINAIYIMRKVYTKDSLLAKANWLCDHFEISPINKKFIQEAIAVRATDFEDAVQFHSARDAGADLIVTRDINGFKNFALPVMTPQEFLAHCAE